METLAAYVALTVAQALASSQSVPGTADDLGGPPTAPTLASRAAQTSPADVIVPVLLLAGSFGGGLAFGLTRHRKAG